MRRIIISLLIVIAIIAVAGVSLPWWWGAALRFGGPRAGLGLRYQTLIGPVRLEYGRNLNPRIDDPAGTLHFSVGFPF